MEQSPIIEAQNPIRMSYTYGAHSRASKSFEPFINEETLLESCPLDNKHHKFEKNIIIPIDALQLLPVEIYHACLRNLDIASLTTMRRVSQYTRLTIDSLYEYQELYQHAPQAIRVCLSTGIGSAIPLQRLYYSLTSMECYYCRESKEPQSAFGPYLCVFTGYRICLFCIRNDLTLKPVDLSTLLHLCCKRNTHISSISTLTLLHTIPGTYGPSSLPSTNSRLTNTRPTILLGSTVKALLGVELDENEELALCGREWTTIYHHPFVQSHAESNILPRDYVQPDRRAHILHRYMSAIRFPYLPTSKTGLDCGVLCKECVLTMQYAENHWSKIQVRRIQMHRDSVASTNRRNQINRLRKAACRMFTTSEEAMGDAYKAIENGKLIADDMYMEGCSLQSHKLRHAREKRKLSEKEIAWRAEQCESPFPILGEEKLHFG